MQQQVYIHQKVCLNKDFIHNIRANQQDDSIFLIHQKSQIDVGKMSQWPTFTNICFESNVYDCLSLPNHKFIASTKNMPIRIYSSLSDHLDWVSLTDRKPNSQLFLAPLQFSKYQDTIIGGGQKFLSKYDLNSLKSQRVKSMDKKYISSLTLIDKSTVVTGQFQGEIQLVDLRTQQSIQIIKPHMDLVTRIKTRTNNQQQFFTAARKDNFVYLWDQRYLHQFVTCMEHPRHNNQRYGLEVSQSGKQLYIGGEKGQIYLESIDIPGESRIIETGIRKCNDLVCSVGERQFPLQKQQATPNYVLQITLPHSLNNSP